jgi:hypothetical protein
MDSGCPSSLGHAFLKKGVGASSSRLCQWTLVLASGNELPLRSVSQPCWESLSCVHFLPLSIYGQDHQLFLSARATLLITRA